MADDSDDILPWEDLFARAEKEIDRTIQSLPPLIREKAQHIQTLLDRWAPDNDEMLGEFHGFEPDHISETLGTIFLFLGPLYLYCQEENLAFEDEIRVTYLHELGHFLGLDEIDLNERGLS